MTSFVLNYHLTKLTFMDDFSIYNRWSSAHFVTGGFAMSMMIGSPFIMAGINTRVVLRSNALLDNAYGAPFYYDEATLGGEGDKG